MRPSEEDPLERFASWQDQARQAGDPGAETAVLATVDSRNQPTTRAVNLKQIVPTGFQFLSNITSRKGRALLGQRRVGLTFLWLTLGRQVNVAGKVDFADAETSDRLWAGRSHQAHAVAIASNQSAPLNDETTLRARMQRYLDQPEPLPRPASYEAFTVVPAAIEFWQGAPDRFHNRLHYERAGGETWTHWLLQP